MDIYFDEDPLADIIATIAAAQMHQPVPYDPDLLTVEWLRPLA